MGTRQIVRRHPNSMAYISNHDLLTGLWLGTVVALEASHTATAKSTVVVPIHPQTSALSLLLIRAGIISVNIPVKVATTA